MDREGSFARDAAEDDDDDHFEDAVDCLPELRIDASETNGESLAGSSRMGRKHTSTAKAGLPLEGLTSSKTRSENHDPLVRAVPDEIDDEPPAFPALNGPQRSLAGNVNSLSASSSRAPALAPELASGPSVTVSKPGWNSSPAQLDQDINGAAAASSSSSPPPFASPSSTRLASLREVLGVPSSQASATPSIDTPAGTSTAPKAPATRSTLEGGLAVPAGVGGGGLMPPPRTTANSAPAGVGGASGASLPVHSSLAASLRAPPTQASASSGLVVRSGTGIAPGSGRKKVVLEPGYGPLDWARLKSSSDLRGGITQLRKITPTELKAHANAEDAWSAFHGKVYNITPYLRYHPGGVKELMRVAGRDGTRLFMLTHSWVNIEAMIDSTMVGFLVPDG